MASLSERPPLSQQQAPQAPPLATGVASLKPPPSLVLVASLLNLLDYPSSKHYLPVSAKLLTSGKDKVKIFEHVAFFLLDTYNPTESAERFAGLWPAYEPLQSKEFRNAVFKWLTDLKRIGSLPTSIIRRSTLDDCHGERYEELLLGLTSMVIKDQVEKGRFGDDIKHSTAYKETLRPRGSKSRMALLSFSYQVALNGKLRQRKEVKDSFAGLEEVLTLKDEELKRAESEMPGMPEEEELWKRRAVEERWRRNWLGDERILNALIQGNLKDEGDRLFEVGFEKALAKGGKPNKSAGGLTWEITRNLDQQQARLEQLRGVLAQFRSTAQGEPRENKRQSVVLMQEKAAMGLGISFDKHQKIKPGQTKFSLKNFENPFSELLDSLRTTLSEYRGQPEVALPRQESLEQPAEISESAFKLQELSFSPLKTDATHRAEMLLGKRRTEPRRWEHQDAYLEGRTSSTRGLDDAPDLRPMNRGSLNRRPPQLSRHESTETRDSAGSGASSRSSGQPLSVHSFNRSYDGQPHWTEIDHRSPQSTIRGRPVSRDYKPTPKDIWEEKRRISSQYQHQHRSSPPPTDDPYLPLASKPQRPAPRRDRTPSRHRNSDSENESFSDIETPLPARYRSHPATPSAATTNTAKPPVVSPVPIKPNRFSLHIDDLDSDSSMADSSLMADHVLNALHAARNLESPIKTYGVRRSPRVDAEGDFDMDMDLDDEGEDSSLPVMRGGMGRGGRELRTPSPQVRAATPQEQLLMSEDPSRVFRSRPKVANSPIIGSPEKEGVWR